MLFIFSYFLLIFIYIKISKTLSAKYHQKNKERRQEKAHKRYQNRSKKEEEKKQQYGCGSYKTLSQDEKQKPVENRKKYYRTRKNTLL